MKNVALITGAAGGIGKEFAKIHASRGGGIIAVDINTEGLKTLKSEIERQTGVEVYTIVKNLTQPTATQEIYEEAKSLGVEIDYLINNAGFGGIGKFYERPWVKDLAMIQVNILALTSLTRFFLPEFVERNSGKILNVSSTASLLPGPLQAVYFATKAYVTSFSNALSGELHNTNVSVTALLPGPTKTNFGAISGMDKTSIYKNTAEVSDVAKDGYDAMMEGKLEVISGLPWSQRMQLSFAPLIPKKMQLQIVRKGQEIQ
ncbi:SDR family NAD(P)-dependent oxidoreductase [Flagellimonas sp.]|uniref:SDR family NAD(P)-dependent oxidoreductase n=1 Tax=Flagellimonas sp. TaxID=2058762 RepID=UPI003C79CD34